MCKWEEVLDFRTNLKAARPDDILHITIHVHNSYKKIFKVKTYKKGRTRHVLQSGWTSILSTIVWDKMKLPCCLKWNSGNVRVADIICKGVCTAPGCNTQIECLAVQKKLKFKIENFDSEYVHDANLKR